MMMDDEGCYLISWLQSSIMSVWSAAKLLTRFEAITSFLLGQNAKSIMSESISGSVTSVDLIFGVVLMWDSRNLELSKGLFSKRNLDWLHLSENCRFIERDVKSEVRKCTSVLMLYISKHVRVHFISKVNSSSALLVFAGGSVGAGLVSFLSGINV